ncbi:hypothetical protein [Nocardioides sp. BYT-33-1]|uniref:hypothetical protein n=1 Tax=Nocardioides sp. BYT-33-1 TaxID=3416952 RepID=UPI003F534926
MVVVVRPTGRVVRRVVTIVSVLAAVAVVLTTTGVVGGRTTPDADRPAAATPVETPDPTVPPPAPPAVAAPAAESAPDPVIRSVAARTRSDDRLADAPTEVVMAYQRAATVINAAAPCNLDWMVLAALGKLASSHGQGPVVGRPLNGKAGRSRVSDTDAGALDGNPRWDAPVGPMGLLPETWARVAVDADGDSVRDINDIDDATLGTAVLLCAGGNDLSDGQALRKALRTYDASPRLPRAVRRLVAAYRAEAEEMSAAALASARPTTVPVGVPLDGSVPAACDCTDIVSMLAQVVAVLNAPVGLPQPPPAPAGQPAASGPPPTTGPTPQPDPEPKPDPEPTPEPKPKPEPEPTPEPAVGPEPAAQVPPVREPEVELCTAPEDEAEQPAAEPAAEACARPEDETEPEAGPVS